MRVPQSCGEVFGASLPQIMVELYSSYLVAVLFFSSPSFHLPHWTQHTTHTLWAYQAL